MKQTIQRTIHVMSSPLADFEGSDDKELALEMRCCLNLQRLRYNQIQAHGTRPLDYQATLNASNSRRELYTESTPLKTLDPSQTNTRRQISKSSFFLSAVKKVAKNLPLSSPPFPSQSKPCIITTPFPSSYHSSPPFLYQPPSISAQTTALPAYQTSPSMARTTAAPDP